MPLSTATTASSTTGKHAKAPSIRLLNALFTSLAFHTPTCRSSVASACANVVAPDPSTSSPYHPTHYYHHLSRSPPSNKSAITCEAKTSRPKKWKLTRHLQSDNPHDINGLINGVATFHLLPPPAPHLLHGSSESSTSMTGLPSGIRELLYKEEGELPMPTGFGSTANTNNIRINPSLAGMKFSKKYIWRFSSGDIPVNVQDDEAYGEAAMESDGDNSNRNDDGNDPTLCSILERNNGNAGSCPARDALAGLESGSGISVWFVKTSPSSSSWSSTSSESKSTTTTWNQERVEEADYLFHKFEFHVKQQATTNRTDFLPASSGLLRNASKSITNDGEGDDAVILPPTPPRVDTSVSTTVLTANGNHLCIADMYRTAYSFRICNESGEVLSWASRHVVNGPKKNQEILNWYEIDE